MSDDLTATFFEFIDGRKERPEWVTNSLSISAGVICGVVLYSYYNPMSGLLISWCGDWCVYNRVRCRPFMRSNWNNFSPNRIREGVVGWMDGRDRMGILLMTMTLILNRGVVGLFRACRFRQLFYNTRRSTTVDDLSLSWLVWELARAGKEYRNSRVLSWTWLSWLLQRNFPNRWMVFGFELRLARKLDWPCGS